MSKARQQANLSSDGNLFADISNDRVGIGSVVPTHKLHVAGTSKFDDDVKFEGATAARYITWDKSANILDFSDSTYLTFGDHNGGDLRLYHSGSHSYIKHQGTGNLYTDIGSGDQYSITTSESAHLADFVAGGAVTLRFNGNEKFITTNTGAKVTGNLEVTGVLTYDDVTSVDSVGIVTARAGVHIDDSIVHIGDTDTKIRFPAANNISFETQGTERFRIYDSNSNGGVAKFTTPTSGDMLNLQNSSGGGQGLIFGVDTSNGYTYWKNNTSSSFDVAFFVGGNTERVRITDGGSIKLPDDGKVELGAAQTGAGDLQIYHSSNQSIIKDTYGDLRICGNTIRFRGGDNTATSMQIQHNGATNLYYSASPKFATSSTGITVTGEVAATQDYPNIRPILDFNFTAVKKLDPRFTFIRPSAASYIDEYGYLKFVGENEPRFDHDPDTGECLGLMIEQAASNLFANTGGTGAPGEEPFAGSNLGNSPTQSIVDDITLPTGESGSVRRVQFHASGNSGLRFGWTSGGSANNPYSASVWARAVSGTASVTIDVNDHDNNTYALTTEWVRMKSTGTTGQAYRFMDLMDGSASDIYIWGLQIEQSDHVTSYIPSYNIAGTQTAGVRELDWVGITGDEHSDIWNPKEGTYVINYKPNEPAVGDGVIIGSRRGTQGSGYPWPLYRHDTANSNIFKSYDNDNSVITISTAWADQIESWALGFNGTNGSIARNGSLVQTNNTNMRGLINADELWLGSNGVGSNQYSMYVKRLMYYAKRISDTQLVTLTTQ